jgi:rhodanese-related sulfurtransferase
MKRLGAILFLAVALVVGCSNSSAIHDVTLDQFHEALASSDTLVLDVRGGMELSGDLVFIDDAKQIPLSTLEGNLSKVPKEKNLYVVGGDSGQTTKAANIMTSAGYQHVFRVNGTLEEYQAKFGAAAKKYLK